jgi:hypothetical protein
MDRHLFIFASLVSCAFAHAAGSNTERAKELAEKLRAAHTADVDMQHTFESPRPVMEFQRAHANAILSQRRLKPSLEGSAPEHGVRRSLASFGDVVWDREDAIEVFPKHKSISMSDILFMSLLGLFAGLAVAYAVFLRPMGHAIVQLMVPGSGEHFTIRPGARRGEYILDIMDVRGNLVRTAGALRPESVARAAVLPPDLAARLGAKGAFDRFEFTREGVFAPTKKEEGYQVFPFEV